MRGKRKRCRRKSRHTEVSNVVLLSRESITAQIAKTMSKKNRRGDNSNDIKFVP